MAPQMGDDRMPPWQQRDDGMAPPWARDESMPSGPAPRRAPWDPQESMPAGRAPWQNEGKPRPAHQDERDAAAERAAAVRARLQADRGMR